MVSVHLEKIFLKHILESKDYIHVVKERFFETEVIKECWKLSEDFYNRYGEAPTRKQIEELVKIKGLEETVTNAKLDIVYDVDLSTYDAEWLEENVEAWIEYKNLDGSVFDLMNYLQTTNVTPENVKDVVNTAKSIILERNNLDFRFDAGLDFFNPDSHEQPSADTFPTGYEHIDRVTGGYSIKTLWVFLGQAKVGKSIWLANMAAQSVKLGYNTAYISLEMRDRKVIKRLGANLLGIKMTDYAKIAYDKDAIKKKLGNIAYESMQVPGKLYVKEYPTSAASVQDVERWLLKMEENQGFKFKTVFIDYVNIMRNWRNPNSENTYMKIKQLAEDLRAMAMRNDWAIITATQVNRAGFDSTDIGMNNVSESSALLHTVDAMFGIIQDPLMHTNREYILKLLANRDEGHKNSKRKFSIDYDYMRIMEDMSSEMWTDDSH
jgi:replicative DNA helicase